jgi:Tol biopolymer transport system component
MRLRPILLAPLLVLIACESDAGPSGPPALHDRIVFVSTRDGARALYHMGLDGSDVTPIPWVHWPFKPEVSPDGEWIAFHGSFGDIWLQRVDGSESRNLTQGAAECAYPVWSPDGSRLMFGCGVGEAADLWAVHLDGSDLAPMDVGPGRYPSWSPAGDQVAFETDRDGNSEVYVLRLEEGELVNLTGTSSANEHLPRWSPDGRWIVYLTDAQLPDGPVTLELIDVAAGTTGRLAEYGVFVGWSPDGRSLVYARAGVGGPGSEEIVSLDIETEAVTVILPPDGFEDDSPTYAPPSPAWPRD